MRKAETKFGVEVNLNPVKVPYRETIKKPVKGVVYRHKKQSGGRGQFAEVHFDVTPLKLDSGFEFMEDLTGMNVPRNFVPAVEKGLVESLDSGAVAGYPVVDLKVRFYDGKAMMWILRKWRLKLRPGCASKKPCRKPIQSYLNPS